MIIYGHLTDIICDQLLSQSQKHNISNQTVQKMLSFHTITTSPFLYQQKIKIKNNPLKLIKSEIILCLCALPLATDVIVMTPFTEMLISISVYLLPLIFFNDFNSPLVDASNNFACQKCILTSICLVTTPGSSVTQWHLNPEVGRQNYCPQSLCSYTKYGAFSY